MLIDVAVYTQEAEAGGWGISGQVELWTETLSLKAKERTEGNGCLVPLAFGLWYRHACNAGGGSGISRTQAPCTASENL